MFSSVLSGTHVISKKKKQEEELKKKSSFRNSDGKIHVVTSGGPAS